MAKKKNNVSHLKPPAAKEGSSELDAAAIEELGGDDSTIIEEIDGDDATATFEALPAELAEVESAEMPDSEPHQPELELGTGKSAAAELPTIRSLGRLEEDLLRLQQSWTDVEQQLAAKDSEIAYLSDERDVHIAAFKSLQSDLDDQMDEYDSLIEKCDALEAKLTATEDRVKAHDGIVAQRDAQITGLQAEATQANSVIEQLRDDCSGLKKQLEANAVEQRESVASKTALEAQLDVLKTEIQSLEAYIDGRKSDWDKLTKELDDYRDAIVGMRVELDAREKTIAGHDKQAASLEHEIEVLRQQCAELDGRRAEREQANNELNALLGEKASEAELLRKERDDAIVGSEAMVARMQDQQTRIHSLEHEVSELSCKQKEIRETADREVAQVHSQAREEVDILSRQLTHARGEVDALTIDASHTNKRLSDAESEIKRCEQALKKLREANQVLEHRLFDEANQRSEISGQLEAARSAEARTRAEYEVFEADMAQRLEANAELIAKLEAELEMRNAAVALLEHNADKLGAINEDVKKLDAKIIEGMHGAADKAKSANITGGRTLMLSVRGMPNIRFPIYKQSMTIGRGSASDIRLRRKYISRCHARLTEDENGVRIEDLNSKNGLYVNEQPVTDSYLHNGDVVDIGEVKLHYLEDAQAA